LLATLMDPLVPDVLDFLPVPGFGRKVL